MVKVNDNVIIKNSIEDVCHIEPKYIGKKGVVVEINNNRPSPISVKVKGVGTDSFWEEELEKI